MRPIEKLIEKRKEEFIRNNLMSDEFIDFIQQNKKPMDKLLSYYACAIMEVETKFRVLDHQYSLEYDRNPIEDIKSRVKSWESLIKKVRRKEIPLTLSSIEENIHDIAGVRVVCSFPDDIYMLADCLLNQDDITLIEKKDYIKNPKPGGYRSLHLIISVPIFLQDEKRMVTVEVQLRTIAMDFWASLEHKIRYKKIFRKTKLSISRMRCWNVPKSAPTSTAVCRMSVMLSRKMYQKKKKSHFSES